MSAVRQAIDRLAAADPAVAASLRPLAPARVADALSEPVWVRRR